MNHWTIQTVVAEILRSSANSCRPFLVALDGGSGAGKSTVARLLSTALENDDVSATVIPGDDFYAAHIPTAEWDAKSAEEKARDCIDWRRLRAEALEPLLNGHPARWHPFDFVAGAHADGTFGMSSELVVREPASTIILDGAYSTRPELADLIDLSVLVDVPVAIRHARLGEREEADFLSAWHKQWDEAEAYYFSNVRPIDTFDLVVTN